MFLPKLKIAVGALLVIAASFGAGAWAYQTQTSEPEQKTPQVQAPGKKAAAQKSKLEELQEEKLRQEAEIRQLTIDDLRDKAAMRKREKERAEQIKRVEEETREVEKERARQKLVQESDRWRRLLGGGKVDIFVDANAQKPLVEAVEFEGLVEIGGKQFLQFRREPPYVRSEQRLLVDPARITSMVITTKK